MASKYTFGRLSDAQILKLADRLFNSFSFGSYTVTIGDMGNIVVSKGNEEDIVEVGLSEFSSVLNEDNYFITEMNWQSGSNSHKIRYLRAKVFGINQHNNAEVWINSDNPFIGNRNNIICGKCSSGIEDCP